MRIINFLFVVALLLMFGLEIYLYTIAEKVTDKINCCTGSIFIIIGLLYVSNRLKN